MGYKVLGKHSSQSNGSLGKSDGGFWGGLGKNVGAFNGLLNNSLVNQAIHYADKYKPSWGIKDKYQGVKDLTHMANNLLNGNGLAKSVNTSKHKMQVEPSIERHRTQPKMGVTHMGIIPTVGRPELDGLASMGF